MRAAVHVVTRLEITLAARSAPSGAVANAVVRTAERLEEAADVVLIAVPAGEGPAVAERLVAAGKRRRQREPARYLNEHDAEFDELGEIIGRRPEARS